jgi:hypothetical protein
MDKSRPDFSFAAATNGLLFLWSAGAKTPPDSENPEERRLLAFPLQCVWLYYANQI